MICLPSLCPREEGSEGSTEHFEDLALPVSKMAFTSNTSVLHRTNPGKKC